MSIKLLKKITLREAAGKPDLKALIAFDNQTPALNPDGTPNLPRPTLWLAQILGGANDYKPGETDKGQFVRFLGQFKGTNLHTGEAKHASSCILPGAIPNMLFAALKGGASSVQFGFRIGVHYDDSAVTKYVYDVESLFDVAENDHVALLEAAISTGKLPALAAPAAVVLPGAVEPATGEQSEQATQPEQAKGKGVSRKAA